MVTGNQDKNFGSENLNNTADANEAQGKTLCDFAMGDSDSLCLGAGYIHPFPEKVTQILLRMAKEKRAKEGLHNKLIQALEARNEQLRTEITQLKAQAKNIEDKFGGLDNMGKEAGLERKPNESDEQYKKRLKEDLQRQLKNGTLDPDSDLALWAQVMQDIDDREAELDANNRALEKLAPSKEEYTDTLADIADLEQRIAKGENKYEAPVLLEELKIAQAAMDVQNEKLVAVVETLENSTADQVVHAWKSDNVLVVNVAESEYRASIDNVNKEEIGIELNGKTSFGKNDAQATDTLDFLAEFAATSSGQEKVVVTHTPEGETPTPKIVQLTV